MTEASGAPIPVDPVSAAIAKASERYARDLNAGADAKVPTGSETTPPPRVRTTDAIHAMYAKARELRGEDVETDHSAMRPDLTTVPAHGFPQKPIPQPEPVAQEQPNPAPLTTQPEYVSVPFQGRQLTVSRRDVERAGGVDAYARMRSAEVEQDQLAVERQRLQNDAAALELRLQEMQRLQAELQQSRAMTAGQGGPATGPGAVAGHDPSAMGDRGAQAEDIDAEAERLSAMFYSGDPEEAKLAVHAILAEARASRQPVTTAEQVARQAVALIQAAAPSGQAAPQQPAPPTYVNPVSARVDAMAAREFPDVINDPVQLAAAHALLLERAGLPNNQERSAVDIAREVCEEVQMIYSNPRRGVLEVKRGLPPVPQAGGALPTQGEPAPLSASEWVERMRHARILTRPRA